MQRGSPSFYVSCRLRLENVSSGTLGEERISTIRWKRIEALTPVTCTSSLVLVHQNLRLLDFARLCSSSVVQFFWKQARIRQRRIRLAEVWTAIAKNDIQYRWLNLFAAFGYLAPCTDWGLNGLWKLFDYSQIVGHDAWFTKLDSQCSLTM